VVALTDAEIRRFEGVVGISILDDPRFATHDARIENGYELADAIADVLLRHSSEHWLNAFREAGVAAMIPKTENNNQAFHRDPVNHAIGRVAQVTDADGMNVREAAMLVRVSGAAVAPHRIAPELGAHTDEVLREHGYSEEKIAELRARGSIR
jgi:crotonobetainyl-CoA:carnitine CoA-transferase CaiB-like acyl-CoA transferase